MMSNDVFLAGYGAAQAVPGPLFTLAAYLGAVSTQAPSGWLGGMIALVGIFLPGLLLIVGILPFWERIRRATLIMAAMQGINAAVVGILLAAFCRPVWTSAIFRPLDFIAVLTGFAALVYWKLPPWLVVGLGAVVGIALEYI